MNDINRNTSKSVYLLMLIPVAMFSIFGTVFGVLDKKTNPLSGLLWGTGIGVVICIFCLIGMFGSEWLKKEAEKGKLLPYLIIGFCAAIMISGYLAINLGKPSCEDSGDAPYSSCTQYANDGFEVSSAQKWDKFWSALPVTLIITSLIAALVRNGMNRNNDL